MRCILALCSLSTEQCVVTGAARGTHAYLPIPLAYFYLGLHREGHPLLRGLCPGHSQLDPGLLPNGLGRPQWIGAHSSGPAAPGSPGRLQTHRGCSTPSGPLPSCPGSQPGLSDRACPPPAELTAVVSAQPGPPAAHDGIPQFYNAERGGAEGSMQWRHVGHPQHQARLSPAIPDHPTFRIGRSGSRRILPLCQISARPHR